MSKRQLEDDKKAVNAISKLAKELDSEQSKNVKLEKQNKHYRMLLKETNSVIREAIESINKGEKVSGLGFMYNSINQQLEQTVE